MRGVRVGESDTEREVIEIYEHVSGLTFYRHVTRQVKVLN